MAQDHDLLDWVDVLPDTFKTEGGTDDAGNPKDQEMQEFIGASVHFHFMFFF